MERIRLAVAAFTMAAAVLCGTGLSDTVVFPTV